MSQLQQNTIAEVADSKCPLVATLRNYKPLGDNDQLLAGFAHIVCGQAGILEANPSRLRPPPPPRTAGVIPEWRRRIEALAL